MNLLLMNQNHLLFSKDMQKEIKQGTMYYWTHGNDYSIISCKKSKNQKILAYGSGYNFEKVQFWAKFDIFTPMGPGQEFSQR